MTRLTSLIHEVIVTTMDGSGKVHSAPMGISEVNDYFIIKPFKPSTTYDNLKRHRQCTINYTDDVRVFAGALTGRRDWSTLPCADIEGEYLEQALAHSEVEITRFEDDDPRACFYGSVIRDVSHAPFRGFNRAQSAVIEAAILVSRLGMLPEQKLRDEIAYLTIAINKTAGDREREAWGWLMEKVKQAGIEINHD
ncbi:DUF447 domain-containing protein [Methylophaga sp. OBS4]|uniref:DUF447 domain-containing protein n=1 Tax=Methylophaga sp. OBS4 TaxID=2991935 RepID=UPI002252C75F|nr:DUF447 domain-containing protein [Methylophaga sp. OBS4]MCX4188316.1 DUF447 family protein [Methylophaga sp. OBS4]